MRLQYMTSNVLKNSYKIIFTVAFFIASSLYAAPAPLMKSLTIVSPRNAPPLKLENFDEDIVDIKEYLGKVVVVNFWATWCPPCRREMHSLNTLYLKMKEKNVVVLTVNVGEEDDAVYAFINSVKPALSFPVLFDTDSKAMEYWGAIGLPSTYIVNKRGKIVYKAVGGRDFESKDIVDKILKLSEE